MLAFKFGCLDRDIIQLVLVVVVKFIICMKNSFFKIKKLKRSNSTRQFIRFCIVGISNTLLGYIIYIISMVVLSSFHYRFDYLVSNIISFIISVFWSFYFNQKFVFQLKTNRLFDTFLSLLRCYSSYTISCVLLYNIVAFLLVEICVFNKYIVPIICLTIAIPLNFILNKYWTFKEK